MKLAVINTELVLRDHYLPDAFVTAEDGIISSLGEMKDAPDFTGYEVVDAKGLYTAPGLVDIHNHSAGTHWFYDEPEEACKETLDYGTTTVLPTIYFSMTKEELIANFKRMQETMKKPEGAVIGGF